MKTQNVIRIIAGFLIFSSALLGFVHNKNWLFITMFVGANLFQYGFSNWCPMEIFLKKVCHTKD